MNQRNILSKMRKKNLHFLFPFASSLLGLSLLDVNEAIDAEVLFSSKDVDDD